MDDIISESWRTPGLPVGNYYALLGNKYAYFYAAQCVNENPGSDFSIGSLTFFSNQNKNQNVVCHNIISPPIN